MRMAELSRSVDIGKFGFEGLLRAAISQSRVPQRMTNSCPEYRVLHYALEPELFEVSHKRDAMEDGLYGSQPA